MYKSKFRREREKCLLKNKFKFSFPSVKKAKNQSILQSYNHKLDRELKDIERPRWRLEGLLLIEMDLDPLSSATKKKKD